MQRLRDQFLAGAAFAENQYRAVNRCRSLDLGEHVFHLLGLPDDLVQPEFLVEPTAEAVDLLVLLLRIDGPADEQDQLVGIDRLGQIVVGAAFDCLHGTVHAAVAGQKDELRFRAALFPKLQQIDAADVPHVQIAEHDVDALVHVADGLVGILGAKDGKSLTLQDVGHCPPLGFVVLNEQNPPNCCHARSLKRRQIVYLRLKVIIPL